MKEATLHHGPFRVHAQKTRIGFIARMTFVNVTLQRRWITVGLILDRTIKSDRFHRVERYSPSSIGHYLKLSAAEQFDDELISWLGHAHRVGTQEGQSRYRG